MSVAHVLVQISISRAVSYKEVYAFWDARLFFQIWPCCYAVELYAVVLNSAVLQKDNVAGKKAFSLGWILVEDTVMIPGDEDSESSGDAVC